MIYGSTIPFETELVDEVSVKNSDAEQYRPSRMRSESESS